AGVPVHADDAYSVVADGAERTRRVGPVPVVVHGIAVVIHRVDPVDVIHVSVAVIVDTVARDLAGIAPHVGREVRVRVVCSGIDVHDHDAATARGDGVPDLVRLNLDEPPQVVIQPVRIVRRRGCIDGAEVVWLRV